MQFEDILKIPDEWVRMVESAVGSCLVNQSIKEGFSVYYWREGNDEVDFVLELQGNIIAIEVKSSISRNTKGMQSFDRKFHPAKKYLIDNKNLSWEEFLLLNPVELF